ncbi:MAG: hypothetical protein QOE20_1500 [Mycobacterium sp.]|nr:hypothetical protein [Mycobacterium sp.]
MSRAGRVVAALVVCTGSLAVACVKPTTFDPAAAPDHRELDRLQTIINDRPNLEVVQQQLTALDGQIRTVIATDAPQTVLEPSTAKADLGCSDPFDHNIGQTRGIEDIYARPAPTPEQWQRITATLNPIFQANGFHLNWAAGKTPPAGSDPQLRDDGAQITLINTPGGNDVFRYSYTTGCLLPASWRTAAPPADQRPPSDPDVHYPYLYGSPGGRTAGS